MNEKYCQSCLTNLSEYEENQNCPICSELEVCRSCGCECVECGRILCDDCVKNKDNKFICLRCYYGVENDDTAWNIEYCKPKNNICIANTK